jgi:hypothetical protein
MPTHQSSRAIGREVTDFHYSIEFAAKVGGISFFGFILNYGISRILRERWIPDPRQHPVVELIRTQQMNQSAIGILVLCLAVDLTMWLHWISGGSPLLGVNLASGPWHYIAFTVGHIALLVYFTLELGKKIIPAELLDRESLILHGPLAPPPSDHPRRAGMDIVAGAIYCATLLSYCGVKR